MMKLFKIFTVLMMIFSGTQIFAEGEVTRDGNCGSHIVGTDTDAIAGGGADSNPSGTDGTIVTPR
jgi:hypothetical protein